MNRAVVLGAACCALAAAAGLYLGEAFGMLVPLGAALAGAVVLGLFAGIRTHPSPSRPVASDDAGRLVTAARSTAEPRDPAAVAAADPAAPQPGIPQGPAETHEVQLKLDLARSYLEMDEAGLAIPLLQEILETELAVAARLGSDAVRETR